ncbi:hypothetical protein SAMN05444166_8450 [Singulisphaera sp. GP187]|uniref:hypothetical protein n=1 Tax=Singulisphaera sp. GP187 TaxID=1882752 RepID=UPI000929D6F0|nr:hypothetical protein [Singulisphaera sp. GP187]SIO67801.1 hypothetical protein SAMN05444166_8450 [Singulisphaera sp. GP187]
MAVCPFFSFKKLGGPINKLIGGWHYGSNLTEFNNNLAAGMSLKDAALNTKTGGYAQHFLGFNDARVINGAPDPTTGRYPGVEIEFTR